MESFKWFADWAQKFYISKINWLKRADNENKIIQNSNADVFLFATCFIVLMAGDRNKKYCIT